MQQASRLTPVQLAALIGESTAEDDRPVVVDVRNAGERDAGYIPGSVHLPLAELARRAKELPTDRPLVVHCAGGWRSSVAASVLRRTGPADVSDLLGGYAAWQAVTEFAGR